MYAFMYNNYNNNNYFIFIISKFNHTVLNY